ncbi:MAG: DUF4261 domain-containing protein [Brevefilum sp.]
MNDTQSYPPTRRPALHLVYASPHLPIPNEDDLRGCLYHAKEDQPATARLIWAQQDAQHCLGTAAFIGHELHIAGLTIPLPREVIDRTVMVSPWGGQIKAAMRHHQAHISLVYGQGSPDPVEQMAALYSLACAFAGEDLLGVVNANAWTAHPPADFLKPHSITSYRQKIPFNLWFGYVRFFTDGDAYWLVTKGHHIFDVPDLAYRVQPGEDHDEVISLFNNVFYYLYEQDVVAAAGDTLEISGSGQKLTFTDVTELEEVLLGPAGTLVLSKDNTPQ